MFSIDLSIILWHSDIYWNFSSINIDGGFLQPNIDGGFLQPNIDDRFLQPNIDDECQLFSKISTTTINLISIKLECKWRKKKKL